jgi:hypothetical protein
MAVVNSVRVVKASRVVAERIYGRDGVLWSDLVSAASSGIDGMRVEDVDKKLRAPVDEAWFENAADALCVPGDMLHGRACLRSQGWGAEGQ